MADWAPFRDSAADPHDFAGEPDNDAAEAVEEDATDRDVMLFLVDCSKSMFESLPDGGTPFHNAIRLASMAYQAKIIASDRDLLGLCFYATKAKRNQFEFPGVYIFHDLDIPDAVRIRELEVLLDSPDFEECVGHCDGPFPLHEALWTAQHLFNHVPKGAAYKRILLITNDDDPSHGDPREYAKCMQRGKDLLDSDIVIELFAQCRPKALPVPPAAPQLLGSQAGSHAASSHHLPPVPSPHFDSLVAGSPSLHTTAGRTPTPGFPGPVASSSVPSPGFRAAAAPSTTSPHSGVLDSPSSSRSPYGSQGSPADPRFAPFNTGAFWNAMIHQGTSPEDYTGSVTFFTADMERHLGLMRRMRRLFRKRSQGKVTMTLGPNCDGAGLDFAVRVYNPIMRASKSKFCWVNADTNKPIAVDTKLLCADTGAELTEAGLCLSYKYGGEDVFFTKDEIARIKTQFGDPGLKILGFKDQARLKSYHHVKHSSFLYPDDQAIKGSGKLFWALHEAMLQQKKVAIGLYIPRQNATPSFVALEPQDEEVSDEGSQIRPPGFVLIPLPFADEIRDVDVPVAVVPTDQLALSVPKAKKLISRLAITFDSDQFEDPVLQRHYACLHALALDKEKVEVKPDLTEPDVEGMRHHRAVIEAFEKAVYPEGYRPILAEKGGGGRVKVEPSKTPRPDVSHIDFPTWAADGRLATCTLPELKEFCRQKALLRSGRKADLIGRIEAHLAGGGGGGGGKDESD